MGKSMKNVLVVALMLFTLLPISHAQLLDVSIEEPIKEVRSGEYVIFEFNVKNNQEIEDKFTVSVSADKYLWWRDPSHLLMVIPNMSEVSMTQGFYPVDAKDGEYIFNVNVKSFNSPNISVTRPVVIKVLPDFYIRSISSEKNGNFLNINMEVDSIDEREVDLVFEIVGSNGVVKTFSSKESVSGIMNLQKSLRLPEFSTLSPGDYKVIVKFEDKSISSDFFIKPTVVFEESKIIVSNPFLEEITTTVVNNGNVDGVFQKEERFNTGDWVTGDVIADRFEESESEKVYISDVNLLPGESQEFTVTVQKWPPFIYLGAVVLAIFLLGILSAGKYTNPSINKIYKRRGKTTSVVLGVKNTLSHSKNVIVRDWVSPLASVEMGAFESVRPVVRRSDAGTELIWSLGNMRPKEERLLSYKIKPVVHGNLKMPRASLRYKNRKNVTRRIFSNSIFIK